MSGYTTFTTFPDIDIPFIALLLSPFIILILLGFVVYGEKGKVDKRFEKALNECTYSDTYDNCYLKLRGCE